jgi:hypothetical protein
VKPAGLSLPVAKYMDVDGELRAQERRAWNEPITWPAWALGGVTLVVVLPGVVTFFRERQ